MDDKPNCITRVVFESTDMMRVRKEANSFIERMTSDMLLYSHMLATYIFVTLTTICSKLTEYYAKKLHNPF
jgi:hypothetical protein